MDREEVLRLGLLTEEQLNNCRVISDEEWDAMMEEEKIAKSKVDEVFQKLMALYEDICE